MGRIRTIDSELSPDQHEMLADLCARNHPAEIDFITDKGNRRLARTRFLADADDGLLIDQPAEKSAPLLLRPGESVMVVYLLEDNRYAFMSSVIRRELFELRLGQRIPALRLRYPSRIDKAQRRDSFRLSVLHLPLAKVGGETSINDAAVRFEGCMVNISAGGACLVLPDQDAARRFTKGDALTLELNLPDALSHFRMPARIVWLEREPAEKRLRMGVVWTLDDQEDEGREIYDRIARFVLIEQQRLLRKEADKRERN
jgi:c-di-GMP-binding flagellar brake protein YcgR